MEWWYKLKRNAPNVGQKQLNYTKIKALIKRDHGFQLHGYVLNVVIPIMLQQRH